MKTDELFLDEVLVAIEENKIELLAWEEDFIDSIKEKIDIGYSLTKKQRESLDRIHSKIRVW